MKDSLVGWVLSVSVSLPKSLRVKTIDWLGTIAEILGDGALHNKNAMNSDLKILEIDLLLIVVHRWIVINGLFARKRGVVG
jgi:hypothetical protein